MIGDKLGWIRNSLNRAGIYTEDLLQGGNPLGFFSVKNSSDVEIPSKFKHIDNKITQLTIKKNLMNYLSHDEELFCENIIKYKHGRTVRYKNTSEYLIVSNSSLLSPLLEYRGEFFSDTWPYTEFSHYLREEGAVDIIYRPNFNKIKNLLDKYIDILLGEYGLRNIFLVRSNPSLMYIKGKGIEEYDSDLLLSRLDFLNDVDNYFINRTECMVIDTFDLFLPNEDKGRVPFLNYPESAFNQLGFDIIDAIYDIESKKNTNGSVVYNSNFLKSQNDFNIFVDSLDRIAKSLSSEDDVRYVEQYSLGGVISLDFILYIYKFFKKTNDTVFTRRICSNLLRNKKCFALCKCIDRFNKNRKFLLNYPYFSGEVLDDWDSKGACLRISDCIALLIDINSEEPIKIEEFNFLHNVNDDEIIKSGYRCDILSAEALCQNIRFYVQRAKKGESRHPVFLTFENNLTFKQSLFVVDYRYLFSNEPFIIGSNVDLDSFCPRTNLEFLFDEKSKIVRFAKGFADQIQIYFFSKCVQGDGRVYYDDLNVRKVDAQHLGYELDKVLKENIEDRCFSNILSDLLLKSFEGKESSVADIFFESGVYNLFAISNQDYHYGNFKKCTRIFFEYKNDSEGGNLGVLANFSKNSLCYYACYFIAEQLLQYFDLSFGDLFSFVDFSDNLNLNISSDMNSYKSIGVHVRRGDYSEKVETDFEYYKNYISKIFDIEEYCNGRLYVFSDDIVWCKTHSDLLGLNNKKIKYVRYIGHNKGDESFRDMQLLMNCDVIISHTGGFSRVAYLMSDKCKIFITPRKWINSVHKKINKGNKYNIY